MSETKVDDYIYTYKNTIDPFLCKKIIKLFENDNFKCKGKLLSGVDIEIKNTIELYLSNDHIKNSFFDLEWLKITKFISKQLDIYVNKYVKHHIDIFNTYSNSLKFLQYDFFHIQKYIKNEGKYVYHNDSNNEQDRYRVITFIFYLNTIENGGETEFNYGKNVIKPEAGKLLLFPSTWTYPHCGKTPLSEDKYIITGWLYMSNNHYVINEVKKIVTPLHI
jgi:hypothetical protein